MCVHVDVDECEKTGEICHNQQCVEYKECHDINQNGKWDAGLDVVIIENDDESFRLIPEPYPYPRGSVWYRVIKNLTDAAAKVIIIDYIFRNNWIYYTFFTGYTHHPFSERESKESASGYQ